MKVGGNAMQQRLRMYISRNFGAKRETERLETDAFSYRWLLDGPFSITGLIKHPKKLGCMKENKALF